MTIRPGEAGTPLEDPGRLRMARRRATHPSHETAALSAHPHLEKRARGAAGPSISLGRQELPATRREDATVKAVPAAGRDLDNGQAQGAPGALRPAADESVRCAAPTSSEETTAPELRRAARVVYQTRSSVSADDAYRQKDSRVNAMLVDPRSSTTVHAHARSEEGLYPARSRRSSGSSADHLRSHQRGNQRARTSMNFKRIAHKSLLDQGRRRACAWPRMFPDEILSARLHKGPGHELPVVSPVKVADDATVVIRPRAALSPMTPASQFPSDLLSFTSEIGVVSILQDRFIRTGSRFAVDDQTTMSAFTTLAEDSMLFKQTPAQLPRRRQSQNTS